MSGQYVTLYVAKQSMPSFRAVIFDLDGTLIDSEAVWTEGLSRWMKSYGKTYEPSFQKELMGKPAIVCVKMMAERYGLEKPIEELAKERLHYFNSAFADMGLVEKPGACDLIHKLKSAGLTIGMATSSDRRYAEAALDSIKCHELFSAVTCGEDIEHGKPAPDIYLKAAKAVGYAPEECVAFEDAPSGVASARAAGMKVVGIADPRYVDALPEATLEVKRFEDVTVERLEELFR